MQLQQNWLQALKMWGNISSRTLYSHPLTYTMIYLLRLWRSQIKRKRNAQEFWKETGNETGLHISARGDLTAIVLKDKWNLNILTNMHCPSAWRCSDTSLSTRLQWTHEAGRVPQLQTMLQEIQTPSNWPDLMYDRENIGHWKERQIQCRVCSALNK
jgi:hypothetical protein